MKVFILSYESLDPEESGVLAIYSNQYAANEALQYAKSLGHYYKLYIEVSFVSDNFSKSDFD